MKKKCGSGAGARIIRAGKRFTLFVSNENVDDMIRIISSLQNSGLLIDGVTDKVKNEIKKQEGRDLVGLMAPMAASLIVSSAFSMLGSMFEKGVSETEKRQFFCY